MASSKHTSTTVAATTTSAAAAIKNTTTCSTRSGSSSSSPSCNTFLSVDLGLKGCGDALRQYLHYNNNNNNNYHHHHSKGHTHHSNNHSTSTTATKFQKKNTTCDNNFITGVHVHAQSCIWYGPPRVHVNGLLDVFELLGKFRHLEQVKIDLNDLPFPIAALTVLFQQQRRRSASARSSATATTLQRLELHHVALEGTSAQYRALATALQSHVTLRSVSIVNCHKTFTFQQLVTTQLPFLEEFLLSGTRLAATTATATTTTTASAHRLGQTLVDLCRSPTLKVLMLEDIGNLTDNDVVYWTAQLSSPATTTTTTTPHSAPIRLQLQELFISSCHLKGDISGNAIARMIQQQPLNGSIQRLTLYLSGTRWKSCGTTMAKLLSSTNPHTTSLVSLNLEIHGGPMVDVLQNALQIIRSLGDHKHNNGGALTQLRLRLDIDAILDRCPTTTTVLSSSSSRDDDDTKSSTTSLSVLQQALEDALETNHQLTDVEILDDCWVPLFPFTDEIQFRLQQNQAGFWRQLASSQPQPNHHGANGVNKRQHDNVYNSYTETVIAHKDNVNLVFFALSQNPTLLVQAAKAHRRRQQPRPMASTVTTRSQHLTAAMTTTTTTTTGSSATKGNSSSSSCHSRIGSLHLLGGGPFQEVVERRYNRNHDNPMTAAATATSSTNPPCSKMMMTGVQQRMPTTTAAAAVEAVSNNNKKSNVSSKLYHRLFPRHHSSPKYFSSSSSSPSPSRATTA